MTDKSFRYDYYPKDAYIDFMQLPAEHVGVLIQICNLIYLNHGPIENNGKYISQSIYDMGTAKCNNVIKKLLNSGHIYLTNAGKISKSMCEKQLKIVKDRRKPSKITPETTPKLPPKLPQNSAKTQTTNEQNQTDSDLLVNSHKSSVFKKEKSIKKEALIIPDFIEGNVWEDFVTHRGGSKFTNLMATRVINQLIKWHDDGYDANEILNNSIMNGYKGIFKPNKQKGTGNGNGHGKPTYHERVKAAGDRGVEQYMADWEARNPCPDDTTAITDQSEL